MRKNRTLFITLVLVSILLAGCVGGGTGIISPNPPIGSNPPIAPNPPITTEPDAIFDGSPTHLSLIFERDIPGVAFLGLNSASNEVTNEIAYVKTTRFERGQQVYSVTREIELEEGVRTFSVDNQLPAAMGYRTTALVLRGNEFIEIGFSPQIDAPAKTITSTTIPMVKPEYTLTFPEKLYSGGSVRQIKANAPGDLMFAYVWIGLNPWDRNGTSGLWAANPGGTNPTGWIVGAVHGFLPEVTEPTKLYYQVGVGPRGDLVPDERNWPYAYTPNVENGEELPYVWIYPHPGWEDENPDWQPE